jgi:hypothetical protein
MSEADFYPAGAYRDPSAPYNQVDVPEKEFDVTCSQTLSKTVSVLTNNYVPGAEGVDYESDDEGGCYAVGWHDPDDTSDTNWADEYHDNDHFTPLQLIELFKQYLENDLNRMGEVKNEKWIKHLIEECSNWTEDETEYVEDDE